MTTRVSLVSFLCLVLSSSVEGAPALSVPLGRWLVVREAPPKGLKLGAGVRLRADGFDTAEHGRGSASPDTCAPAGAELRCAAGLVATALAPDSVRLQQGSLTFSLGPASALEAANFDKWLADTQAQQEACTKASRCCRAAEGPLAQPCDVKATLGDRSLATCKGALDQVRAVFSQKKLPLPEVCR